MRTGRSNQGPAKIDTPPAEGYNPKDTRQNENEQASRDMRRDVNEVPDDYVMPAPPPGRNPSAPTRIFERD